MRDQQSVCISHELSIASPRTFGSCAVRSSLADGVQTVRVEVRVAIMVLRLSVLCFFS
jgi:hypothetical protein